MNENFVVDIMRRTKYSHIYLQCRVSASFEIFTKFSGAYKIYLIVIRSNCSTIFNKYCEICVKKNSHRLFIFKRCFFLHFTFQNPVIVSFLTEMGFSALDHDYCCTTARMGSFKFIFKKISGVLEFFSEKNV